MSSHWVHLLYFHFCRYHYPVLCVVQRLRTVASYILSNFIFVHDGRDMMPVILSWPKLKVKLKNIFLKICFFGTTKSSNAILNYSVDSLMKLSDDLNSYQCSW